MWDFISLLIEQLDLPLHCVQTCCSLLYFLLLPCTAGLWDLGIHFCVTNQEGFFMIMMQTNGKEQIKINKKVV